MENPWKRAILLLRPEDNDVEAELSFLNRSLDGGYVQASRNNAFLVACLRVVDCSSLQEPTSCSRHVRRQK